ncbi:MAG: cytochrome b [Pseudomonadota bacterium]
MNSLTLDNSTDRYGLVAQALHWIVVFGIALQFIWAWRIDEAESIRQQFALVNQHKSIGVTVLALVLIRIAWRLLNRPPAYPDSMKTWERRAAGAAHWGLYGLLLVLPISGWAYSAAAGYGPEWFGWINLPALFPVSETLESAMHEIHEWSGRLLMALVIIHVVAALRHQFVLKDGLLRRMWGGGA